jgi:hypothetical protein
MREKPADQHLFLPDLQKHLTGIEDITLQLEQFFEILIAQYDEFRPIRPEAP